MTAPVDNSGHAVPFAIFRAAATREWQCGIDDIARITGVEQTTVRRILRRHGWRLTPVANDAPADLVEGFA